MVRGIRSDERRSRGAAWLTVALALVFLVSGVFIPAARGASADQTQEQLTPTPDGSTTTAAPSTSTTYVTVMSVPPPATSTTLETITMSVPATVTTIVSFPFLGPAEDSSPPSTMPGEPERALDQDGDQAYEPPVADRDLLPSGGPEALSAANASAPAPSTTLLAQSKASASNVASRSRAPSLLWPGLLAVGCLLLLCGPAAARKWRHAQRHDPRHDVRHDVD